MLGMLPKHSVGAEIGVFQGQFTREILRVVRPRRLHLVDSWWLQLGEYYPNWGAYTDFGRLRTREAYDRARQIAAAHAEPHVCQFHVADDVECLATFPDCYFDWVYLDTSHEYERTRRELSAIARVLKPAGLLMGDDWIEDPSNVHHGVCRAVTELCETEGWQLVARDIFSQWCIQRRPDKVPADCRLPLSGAR